MARLYFNLEAALQHAFPLHLTVWVLALGFATVAATAGPSPKMVRITLKSGTELTGRVVFEDENRIVIERDIGGTNITSPLRKAEIDEIERLGPFRILQMPRVSTPSTVQAPKRVALLVGCGDYDSDRGRAVNGKFIKVPDLANPANDVRDMAEMFRDKMGFSQVETLIDPSQVTFYEKLGEFRHLAKNAEIAVFYYSGHGVEFQGKNYLVPVDAGPATEAQAKAQAIPFSAVTAELKAAGVQTSIAILDCCRENPFAKPGSTKSITDELVLAQLGEAEIPDGTLIAFATSPGRKAAAVRELDSKNSLFTEFLLKHLPTPGLSIRDVFDLAADESEDATNGGQIPYLNFKGSTRLIRNMRLVHSQPLNRVALVIGMSKYRSEMINTLEFSDDDAREFAEYLRSIHYNQVTLILDSGMKELQKGIKDFQVQAKDADLALVYYGGVSLCVPKEASVGTEIFLVPVDCVAERKWKFEDAIEQLVPLNSILSGLDRPAKTLVIDSSRTNGLELEIPKGSPLFIGLRPNTLAAYACDLGQESYELQQGKQPGGVFTKSLLKHLQTHPNLGVNEILALVGNDVREIAKKQMSGTQTPVFKSNLHRHINPFISQ